MEKSRKDTRWMVSVALMAAIVILLANTPLGMIQLPIIKATTVHIPVIIGAVLLGPLAGAILGVVLNLVIPEEQVKMLLYLVVLLSGISILLRKDSKKGTQSGAAKFSIEKNLPMTLLLGFLTGAVCSMSGAGGPVLVMPLLVVFGISIRTAVGVALFNSIFIGIPAVAGYLAQCDLKKILPVLLAALAAHAVGVYYGSKNAERINQGILKKGVAVFSIVIAGCRLTGIM